MANMSSDQQMNYLFITPAVSIDHNFDNGNSMSICVDENINVSARNANHNNNNNIYSRREKQSFIYPGHRSNGMPRRSWRWCALICSAVRCFGNSTGFSTAAAAAYTSNTYTDHVLDLIVSNEAKAQNIPYEL